MIINKKKIKTLVCIIGQTRAHEITWNSFNKYVLKSLDADLALCVAEQKSKKNKMYENAKYIWRFKDSKDYSKKFDNAQKKLIQLYKIKTQHNWKSLLKIKNFWLSRIKGYYLIKNDKGIYSHGTGALLIYNRWVLLRKILELKLYKKYDRFIITRSDFIWNLHHPKLSNLNPNYIWIPNGERYGGYTDRHAVLSKYNFYDYLNLIEPILIDSKNLYDKMKSKSNWNLERYIKFHLNEKGYSNKIKFFPYIMYSIRNEKIRTTWRPGDYSIKHKYFIKYFKEYLSSFVMFFLIGPQKKAYNNYFIYFLFYKIIKNFFKFRFFLMYFLNKKSISKNFDKKFILKNLKKKFLI